MSDYITELESELIRAGRERERRRARFRWGWAGRLPRAGGVATALGVTVAIAVAALAIVLIGHSRPRAQPAGAGHVPAAAQNLVSMLAVLRRPQTAADRTLPGSLVLTLVSPAGGGRTIMPSLTRLVATVPNAAGRLGGRTSPRVRLYLIVTTPTTALGAGVRPRVYSGDLVSIAWVTAAGRPAAEGVSRGVPAALLHGVPTMRPALTEAGYNVGIVPDGVTRVRWSFVDGTVYPTIQHNLALAPSIRSTNVGNGAQTVAVFEPKYLAGVTWYGSQGHVISSFSTPTANPFAHWKLVAQINLQPPRPRPAKATGIAAVYKNRTSRAIRVTAIGLAPNTHRNAYAIWLYTSPSQSRLLGFVNPRVRSNGRLSTAGTLPRNAQGYAHLLITLEDKPSPKVPGKIVLEGRLQLG